MIGSFMLTSCGGGSVESDAKALAELQCKAQKLAEKTASGDESAITEAQKLGEEIATLTKDTQGKYTSESDMKTFTEVLMKEMENCK